MREVWISGAIRTPIGTFNGNFAGISAVDLGKTAARKTLEAAGVEAAIIDETIIGNVLQAGLGQNPARQIALGVDIPEQAPAFTINKVCGSGMKALDLGWQAVQLHRADVVLVGGIENMTQAPYLLPTLRNGARLGNASAIDSVVADGLTDVFNDYHMGMTAENVAAMYTVSREEQDLFALGSQQKYAAALEQGLLEDELAPVMSKSRKHEITIDRDEHPRPDCTLDSLSKLKPVFKKDGTVTAGNASGINDGAATLIVAAADGRGRETLNRAGAVKYVAAAAAGCQPAAMGLGPVYAVRKLLQDVGLTIDDIDLWELNEAFAAQSIAVLRELQLEPKRVNVNGGAIALGHPIGASGARIVVTLIHELKRRQVRRGIAGLCIGGGMGMALLLENT